MSNPYKITPLKYILENDRSAINIIGDDLQKRGYAFIRLNPELVNQIDECMSIIEKFFLQQTNYKKTFSKDAIFGYFGVDHKESIRFLTGTRLIEHKIPNDFGKITNLIKYLDRIMYSITLLSAPILFPNIISEAKKLDIPLIRTDNPWGMFDIAKYYNDGTRIAPNCAEHFDPGLLSLSLRSTEPGLQLKDENGKWIIPPNDKSIAIMWAGTAATKINPQIKPGVHKVVNPINFGKPRISMWYEICTSAQEHTELLNPISLTTKSTSDKINPIKFESKTGIPMTKSIQSTQHVIKSTFDPIKFESSTGIPMTKSGLPMTLSTPKKEANEVPIRIIGTQNRSFGDPSIKLKKSSRSDHIFPTNMSSSPMFKSYNPF